MAYKQYQNIEKINKQRKQEQFEKTVGKNFDQNVQDVINGTKGIDEITPSQKAYNNFKNGSKAKVGDNGSAKSKNTVKNKTDNLVKKDKEIQACLEGVKEGWNNFWDGVWSKANKAWNAIGDFRRAVWNGLSSVGAFVVKQGKNFLSWVDAVVEQATKVASVIVFAAGVVAIGATIAAAIPALAGTTVLGASLGAIASSAGSFALYTGAVNMGASMIQTSFAYGGIRLDGSKLTPEQAQRRIANGQTNIMISYTGAMMGGSAILQSTPKYKVYKGTGRGKENRAIPNSIYEQLSPEGTIIKRYYYDNQGRMIVRDDFLHTHFDKTCGVRYDAHSHYYNYDSYGNRKEIYVAPI